MLDETVKISEYLNSKKIFKLFFSANYFVDCINEQDLDEMNVEVIRNTLYKAYIEDFYKFCAGLGGKTAEVMCDILAVRFF